MSVGGMVVSMRIYKWRYLKSSSVSIGKAPINGSPNSASSPTKNKTNGEKKPTQFPYVY